MKVHWPVLWVASALVVVASCQSVKRDFSPGAGGDDAGAAGEAQSGAPSGGSGNSGAAGADEGGAGGGGGATGGAGGDGGACEADALRCNGDVPEACGSDGAWQPTHASCAFGCRDGACNDCEDDSKGCENGEAKLCVGGKWQYTPCDVLCEQGECVDACTEGARQCEGLSKVQVCSGGKFVDDEECAGVCSNGACLGECKPDTLRCQPGSSTVPQVCSAQATWTDGVCADGSVCLDGHCVACEPDSVRCSALGVPQRCTDFGSWADDAPCPTDTPACVDGSCVLCSPDARRCLGGRPQQCSGDGGQWVDQAECRDPTPACVAATGECGTCRAGERQCGDDNTPQVCENGRWQDASDCTGSTPACVGGACVECHPKESQCDGATPKICNESGRWQPQPECAEPTPRCMEATGTCGCVENAADCQDATTPRLCSATGSWVIQTACDGDTPVCQDGRCSCVEGTQECTSSTTPRSCVKGQWEPSTCAAPTPVCVGGRCAECVPGNTRCSGDGKHIVERCSSDGVWKEDTQCADFCVKGRCLNPASDPTLIGCDAVTGLICKGVQCCFVPDGKSSCQDLSLRRCATGSTPINCDGPSDCAEKTPICCATPSGAGCVATLTDCTTNKGQVVCDPENAATCPKLTTCTRASDTLFTCQAARL